MADDEDISNDSLDYVKAIDQKIGSKYDVSLYDVLNDPNSLKGNKNPKQVVIGMREDISTFFDSLTSRLKTEQDELDTQLGTADALYKRLNDVIRNKASFAGIPYLRPVDIIRDTGDEENIVVDKYDGSVDTLVTRLVGVVHYIADLSTKYKEFVLGTWLFSGNKNYLLTINPPSSILFNIEMSKREINQKLDSIEEDL